MSDTVEMQRKLRVTVTIEEMGSTKSTKTASSKEFWNGLETSLVRQAINFVVDCVQYLFSRLLGLLTGR